MPLGPSQGGVVESRTPGHVRGEHNGHAPIIFWGLKILSLFEFSDISLAQSVFQTAKRVLDAPLFFLETSVETGRLFSVGSVWNDRLALRFFSHRRSSALSYASLPIRHFDALPRLVEKRSHTCSYCHGQ
jgi:hypothetical protein